MFLWFIKTGPTRPPPMQPQMSMIFLSGTCCESKRNRLPQIMAPAMNKPGNYIPQGHFV